MVSAVSQTTLVNGVKNSTISASMMKAIKAIASFAPKVSKKAMLPMLGLSTILYYDKITEVIENALPNTLKNINVPLPKGLKQSVKAINDAMKNTSPQCRQALQDLFTTIIGNLHAPIRASVDGISFAPHFGVPAAIVGLTKVASVALPQIKALQVVNGIINTLFVMILPVAAMYSITAPLYDIASTLRSMSPAEIVRANQQATKIKLKGEGFEPLEAKIWDSKKAQDYETKPLHYPDTVTNKIDAFETILKAPKTGKSGLQAFIFYGPPGTGKTSIMNKLSATVTETVNNRGGTTHHYQINSKDLKQFDWKLEQLTKFVNGEEIDEFYKVKKKQSWTNWYNPFDSNADKFEQDTDAICIQIDEANQMGSDNLAKLQSTITKLEDSGQKVVIFMTTNYLDQIPLAMQRRIEPLEIGFPNEDQKEAILRENIEKLTVEGEQVFNDKKKAKELTDALIKAFGEVGGATKEGIMGDHIVKSLHHAIKMSITRNDLIKCYPDTQKIINKKLGTITTEFSKKMEEFVAAIPQNA